MPQSGDRPHGRGIPDALKDAIEGAFDAAGRTRDRAGEISEKTLDRTQGLVDQVSRRGQEARDTLEGLRLVSRDELARIEQQIEDLSQRVKELEGGSGPGSDG